MKHLESIVESLSRVIKMKFIVDVLIYTEAVERLHPCCREIVQRAVVIGTGHLGFCRAEVWKQFTECQIEKLVPHPQFAVAFGFTILNAEPINSLA